MNIRVIDLTKPLGTNTEIFSDGEYIDPDFAISEWSSIDIHDFRVSSIRLGTQTGTHIDAPAHFTMNGSCLDRLDISELMGSYYLIDLDKFTTEDDIKTLCSDYKNEKFFFIRSFESSLSIVEAGVMKYLVAFPPAVWILNGIIEINGTDKYGFHRILAESGKYLVEDLDHCAAERIISGGEIFVFPLRLENVSGSPCRIAVRYI